MATLERYLLSEKADDVRFVDEAWFHSSNPRNVVGYGSSTEYARGGDLLFPSITIAKDTFINEAHITLRCRDLNYAVRIVNSKIRAAAQDNVAAYYGNLAAYQAETRTTAFVYWDDIAPWYAYQDYDTPDISSVIQEIVNRAGWVSGNGLMLFWDDHDDRSSHVNEARRWTIAYAPEDNWTKLTIVYGEEAYMGQVFIT